MKNILISIIFVIWLDHTAAGCSMDTSALLLVLVLWFYAILVLILMQNG